MRKLTLAALLVIFAAAANAQFTKGDKYLGGSFQFKITDQDVSDNSSTDDLSIFISPSFTKFKSDRRATGFRLITGYQYNKNNNGGVHSEFSGWHLGAGIFAQRYLLLGKGFFLAGEYGANLATFMGQTEFTIPTPPITIDVDTYTLSLYFTPHLGYKLSERLLIGLNFSNIAAIDVVHHRYKNQSSTGTSRFKNTSMNLSSSLNNTSLGNLAINFAWKLR